MKEDLTAYLMIVLDICFRYFHLAYIRESDTMEWLVFLNTEALRHIEVPAALLLHSLPLSKLARKITWTWGAWLTWDFLQQLGDNNRGAQIWELVLFILICSIIIHAHSTKNRELV